MIADRVRLGASLPVVVHQGGEIGAVGTRVYSPPNGAALGDLRLDADVVLAGAPGGAFRFGLGALTFIPLGDRSQYAGDHRVRVAPRLMLAGDGGPVRWAARAGVHLRPRGDGSFPGLGNEAEGAAAVGMRVGAWLIGPEVFASTSLDDSVSNRTTPVEAMLGAQLAAGDWRIGLGAGRGLTGGLGAPGFRAVVRLEYTPTERPEAPPPPPRRASPAASPKDRDADGVPDAEDACPDEPGPTTADARTNGCPGALDRDGDGVPDADDACPDIAGGKSSDPRTSGCPDRDGDGIYDLEDACPEERGARNADRSRNGCPVARVEKGQIRILEQVKFKSGSAQILSESDPVLEAVATVLRAHPEIKKVRVEGHTDNRGSPVYNQGLSRQRAAAVARWLVEHKIERERLTSEGFGRTRPIATNKTEEGRRENRRVELHIVDPPPSDEAP
jgi:outer membrane protein OmpA-like peptidoglycan-associated protein